MLDFSRTDSIVSKMSNDKEMAAHSACRTHRSNALRWIPFMVDFGGNILI